MFYIYNMKIPKLTQQAMVVGIVACLPVLCSLYKMRSLDALVLIISGSLAVYNVNCLTKGNCNAWATLVAVSFFITTLFQLRISEGQIGATPTQGGQTGATPTQGAPSWTEYSNTYKPLPDSNSLKAQMTSIQSSLGTSNSILNSLSMLVTFVNTFQDENSKFDENAILTQIMAGTSTDEGGLLTQLATRLVEIQTSLANRRLDIFGIAEFLLDDITGALNVMCGTLSGDSIIEIINNLTSIELWQSYIEDVLKLASSIGDLGGLAFQCAPITGQIMDAAGVGRPVTTEGEKTLRDDFADTICNDPKSTQEDRDLFKCPPPE
jgi:hypothetical protein